MMRLILRQTDAYEKLVQFFVENELEFDGDEEVDTDIVRCFEIVHGAEEHLVGAVVLAKREGRYIIDGIAVDAPYRKLKVGNILLQKVIDTVKELGGDSLYLVARAPGFFRANGFTAIDPETAPNFFECKYCPQYQKNCHPEVMKLEIA
ncbi:MAG: GNAT family N-acetyltransferase [Emergencia sp.]|jgi:amino-acid N-acetyltransferase|uniref:GNAT family N-acetyltransferase n=1 Tax=Anaerotruncus colihominis TaxID=169435 RepID=A0A845QML3_9FIRM|nr:MULTISPECIES: GNAT family N-acetyltransferase [Clostridia]MCI9475725.1 GNAT family N-acetyltransferase [Emergencia sp.]MCI9638841.1 GNAT family N-acetyltransferase [Emergencia sp.]NBH61963.1 GNAT family N-acetyltransferase [Anaerotruncus colihominis]NCE97615.1 GNAT family N-acetyltransferase [Emergencia sp. 1XD21-10]NCF02618.1 GNAT family N-acetyltransferase [Anaerotruncus sp. 80]